MLARSVLALCAFGAVAVSAATRATATTDNRGRRATFLNIVNRKEKPNGDSNYKSPILPVELPIKLEGHGGVNLPVLVVPVPVPFYPKSDSCQVKNNDNSEVSQPAPQQIIPAPYIANRYQIARSGDSKDQLTVAERIIVNAESAIEYNHIAYARERGHIFATDELVQSYRRQTPTDSELPAVMPHGRVFPARHPASPPPPPPTPAPAPPRPRFTRSLALRIDLAVPHSDYTEVYDMVWEADSNTVHTIVEDGATMFYRVPRTGGSVQFLKIQEDRLIGTAVKRCTMSSLLPATPADSAFPGLPDLSPFYFAGYTTAEGQSQVEHWQHFVVGAPGEGGAARGEALNYTHDFFVYRDGWDAVPLRYTVVTDSSILGPNSDYYSHRYRLLPTPTAPILPDLAQCHVVEEMTKEDMQHQGLSGKILRRVTSIVNDLIHQVGEDVNPGNNIQTQPGALDNIIKTVTSSITNFFNPKKQEKGHPGGDSGNVASEIASAARNFFHPIGDFLGPTKPAKYDTLFENYKTRFNRKYRDEREEAVRKAQLIKTNRFVDAANRYATTFKTGINDRADRTQDEKDLSNSGVPLVGATKKKEHANEFETKDAKLIIKTNKTAWEAFDWRENNYKSEVFHQGETCNSCWACALAAPPKAFS